MKTFILILVVLNTNVTSSNSTRKMLERLNFEVTSQNEITILNS